MCGAHAGAIFEPDDIPIIKPKRIPDKRAIIADTRAILPAKQRTHRGSDPADAGANGCGTPDAGADHGADAKADRIAIGPVLEWDANFLPNAEGKERRLVHGPLHA